MTVNADVQMHGVINEISIMKLYQNLFPTKEEVLIELELPIRNSVCGAAVAL